MMEVPAKMGGTQGAGYLWVTNPCLVFMEVRIKLLLKTRTVGFAFDKYMHGYTTSKH